jgi:RND family efflux transporter MFP subunit
MKKQIIMTAVMASVLLGSVGASYAAFAYRGPMADHALQMRHKLQSALDTAQQWRALVPEKIYLDQYVDFSHINFDRLADLRVTWPQAKVTQVSAVVPIKRDLTLSEMQAGHQSINENTLLEPAAGGVTTHQWTPEQDILSIEAVLVPRQVTVISSSQDGKIANILVGQGDHFKKGDTLIEYDCADLEAEAEIAGMQKNLTAKKSEGGDKLFKLDIISDVDRLGVQVEDKQADARIRLYQARLDHCKIKAEFNGRVTNRLANPGEYTRTDRVLMEVASDETLQAEFLVPSKWLRWVNVGAPLDITIGENEMTYKAKISRIYGEVDPASQSIQMIAVLDGYDDPLLPGMSGQAKISVSEIEKAGVKGYLQTSRVQ